MTIENKCDLKYPIILTNSAGDIISIDEVDFFEARFYTENINNYLICFKEFDSIKKNIINEDGNYYCILNADELKNIYNGIIKFRYKYSIIDDKYEDGFYDNSIDGITNYYLKLRNNDGSDIDLSNYYTKDETYSKLEVENLVQQEKIDLSEYYKKAETDLLLDGKVNKEIEKGLSNENFTLIEKIKLESLTNYDDNSIKTDLEKKVDKITGKVLSDNNFTTIEKNKLESLTNYDDSSISNRISNLENEINGATQIINEINALI